MKLSSDLNENQAESQASFFPLQFPYCFLWEGTRENRELVLHTHQYYFLVFLSLDRGI